MLFKKFITLLAAFCSVSLPQFSYAQQTNDPSHVVEESALKIQHEPTLIAVRSDDPVAISATVTAAAGTVEEVLLFYRTGEVDIYRAISMRPAGNDLYSVVLPAGEAQVPKFEYYIQAKDQHGHTASRAGMSMPFQVTVSANASTVASAGGAIGADLLAAGAEQTIPTHDAPQADEKKSYVGWILGAVAVVLVLALAGGGGGGDAGPGTSANPTGTVVIVGPAPAH